MVFSPAHVNSQHFKLGLGSTLIVPKRRPKSLPTALIQGEKIDSSCLVLILINDCFGLPVNSQRVVVRFG